MLMKYGISYNAGNKNRVKASCKHITDCYNSDIQVGYHKLKRTQLLKECHINPKMKEKMRVKYAAQIFSYSLASGIYSRTDLPPSHIYTGEFLELMDKIFDSCLKDDVIMHLTLTR